MSKTLSTITETHPNSSKDSSPCTSTDPDDLLDLPKELDEPIIPYETVRLRPIPLLKRSILDDKKEHIIPLHMSFLSFSNASVPSCGFNTKSNHINACFRPNSPNIKVKNILKTNLNKKKESGSLYAKHILDQEEVIFGYASLFKILKELNSEKIGSQLKKLITNSYKYKKISNTRN